MPPSQARSRIRSRPLTQDEARCFDDHPRKRKLMENFILRMQEFYDSLEYLDPGGSSATYGFVTGAIAGAIGPVAVPNYIGLVPGNLVHYAAGAPVIKADQDAYMATHAVGAVFDGQALIYSGWAYGPLRLDGQGAEKVVYLGKDGNATLEEPEPSELGTRYYQVVGVRIGAGIAGPVNCQFIVDNLLTRI